MKKVNKISYGDILKTSVYYLTQFDFSCKFYFLEKNVIQKRLENEPGSLRTDYVIPSMCKAVISKAFKTVPCIPHRRERRNESQKLCLHTHDTRYLKPKWTDLHEVWKMTGCSLQTEEETQVPV